MVVVFSTHPATRLSASKMGSKLYCFVIGGNTACIVMTDEIY